MYTRNGSDDVTAGGGVLLFEANDPVTKQALPGGFSSFGNTTVFNFTTATEKRDHWNSDGELKIRDVSIVTQLSRNGNITVDEISADNLSRMLFTNTAAFTQAGGTSTEVLTLQPGSVFNLGATPSTPSGVRGIDPLNPPTLTPVGGGAALVLGTDFEIEYDDAIGYIPFDGAIQSLGQYTLVTKYVTTKRDYIISGDTPLTGALQYLQHSQTGQSRKFYMPLIRLTPNGEFNLKADDWLTIPFTFEILRKGTMKEVYVDGRPYLS